MLKPVFSESELVDLRSDREIRNRHQKISKGETMKNSHGTARDPWGISFCGAATAAAPTQLNFTTGSMGGGFYAIGGGQPTLW
ncbi:hypothetical protein MASR1M66_23250 [Aminivibrio sp.]